MRAKLQLYSLDQTAGPTLSVGEQPDCRRTGRLFQSPGPSTGTTTSMHSRSGLHPRAHTYRARSPARMAGYRQRPQYQARKASTRAWTGPRWC